jgi:imidazole glycerol-phosphate synthase subunit HisH
MVIVIIDYGMGNLGSIKNMLTRLGFDSIVSADIQVIKTADKLILPGVGSFDNAMVNLERLNFISTLNFMVIEKKVPILGICLGMQLFSKRSEEGTLRGFGWIDAETIRFNFHSGNSYLKTPHMGWNTIAVRRAGSILDDIGDEPRFYFVHSYHVHCKEELNVLATTTYGIEFHSAIIKNNIIGTQFHPEKSHKFGMKVLRNFAEFF